MISNIEIKNFKCIKSRNFPLRNLNVLLGLNGQGKSSFIQSLLLLRQSNKGYSGYLNLRGDYVNIGNTKDAFYQYNKKEHLIFDLSVGDIKIPFQYAYEIEKDYLRPQKNGNKHVDFETLIKNAERKTGLFSNYFQYLNAFRIPPKSIHPKSNYEVVDKKNLGMDGKYTAHFIEIYYDEEIAFANVLHSDSYVEDSLMNKRIVDKTLGNQINLWLGEISPNVKVKTTTINRDEVLLEYEFEQPNYGRTNKFKPANVGFGVTYSLPVVTALLSAKPGALLIIENPESHIHPKGQAALGKLIALVAQNDVQIIIETHSDHILNGIRVAVKEEDISKDKVRLFYFEKIVEDEEQYAAVTDIILDKNGSLSEYPENLLEEWTNQLAKLI